MRINVPPGCDRPDTNLPLALLPIAKARPSACDAPGQLQPLRDLVSGWVLGDGALCSATQMRLPQLPGATLTEPTPGLSANAATELTKRPAKPAAPSIRDGAALLGSWVTGLNVRSGALLPVSAFRPGPAQSGERPNQSAARCLTTNVPALAKRAQPPSTKSEVSADRRRIALEARLDDAIATMSVAPGELNLAASLRALHRLKARLGRPSRVVIAGGINSGKSSLANHLLGAALVPTDVQRNSYIPTLLHFAEAPEATGRTRQGVRAPVKSATGEPVADFVSISLGIPLPRLRRLEILDLPGLDDDGSSDNRYRSDLQGDMLIWCTSGANAWSDAERRFWSAQPRRLKQRSLLVVTHPELMTRTRHTERLLRRIYSEAETEFRDILLMSAISPSERGARRLTFWLRQLTREAATERLEAATRTAVRISNRLQLRLQTAGHAANQPL